MSWGEVELEDEVHSWYLELNEDDQARVRFHIDRLAEFGPLLDEPFTRQLRVLCVNFASCSVDGTFESPIGLPPADASFC